MICYVLAMGKQHLGPHVVVGYGIKIFLAGPFHYVTRSPGGKLSKINVEVQLKQTCHQNLSLGRLVFLYFIFHG